jgi:hypothetical protein
MHLEVPNLKRLNHLPNLTTPPNWTNGDMKSFESALGNMSLQERNQLEACVMDWLDSLLLLFPTRGILFGFHRAKLAIEAAHRFQQPALLNLLVFRRKCQDVMGYKTYDDLVGFSRSERKRDWWVWKDRTDHGYQDFRDFYMGVDEDELQDCYYIE